MGDQEDSTGPTGPTGPQNKQFIYEFIVNVPHHSAIGHHINDFLIDGVKPPEGSVVLYQPPDRGDPAAPDSYVWDGDPTTQAAYNNPQPAGDKFMTVTLNQPERPKKFTIGYAWAKDYGTSEDSKDMFEYLHHYSPVHNAKPQVYPATLVTTADHDDRVVPAHSYKFISALQAAQTGQAPVLIRIDKKAGHGAGKPTDLRIEEYADELAFIMFNLNIKDFK